ncbi:FecR domain-containing protein [Chitinophaga varians]|uniref:FecR domain-containing protein n=1 Tax=Chitinophaga varians TaxID=2202339 RepID=UPI00165FCD9B|nr:FecR domain-containing protein [Chitinophaga varians]MBC9912584.1 FecR domain-containing protein [Chitinophaga varians]
MEQARLKALLQRYLDNSLPPEELKELIAALQQDTHQDTFLQELQQALAGGAYATPTDAEKKDVIFRSILRKAEAQETSVMPPPARRRVSLWKAAVAAMVIVLAGVAAYFATGHRFTGHRSALARQDVPPGGNKATLLLADGSYVTLDSTHKGMLARQGNATVSQTGHGQLAYDGTNANEKDIVYNTVFTPRGGQFSIVLPDGSKVWLNAASSLRFPTTFPAHERRVEVTGEAYFEVAPQQSRPFKVSAPQAEVTVLGTNFNVNSYMDDGAVKTTLLEGRVLVTHQGHTVTLKPGQQAQTKAGIRILEQIDTEALMAWKNGRFSCNDIPLENIMQQISRWYDVQVIFKDNITDTYSIEVSRDVPLSKLLRFLELSGGVHFEVNGKTITVKK